MPFKQFIKKYRTFSNCTQAMQENSSTINKMEIGYKQKLIKMHKPSIPRKQHIKPYDNSIIYCAQFIKNVAQWLLAS